MYRFHLHSFDILDSQLLHLNSILRGKAPLNSKAKKEDKEDYLIDAPVSIGDDFSFSGCIAYLHEDSFAREDSDSPVSEVGLVAISEGCKKLCSILHFCNKMTNAAVVAMSKNYPDLVVFRLCIMGRHLPDHLTGEPMDMGFGAIVMNCKKLIRLALSGLLTDKAFYYIGQYGKLVRTLSVAFEGDTDVALTYVLRDSLNARSLRLEIALLGMQEQVFVLGLFARLRSPFDYVKSQIQKMRPNAIGKYSFCAL
ncbi:hypothetical protein IFM89_017587 [Coptis chinensis]|uniref:Uncharacterized protein n=1 Tax=Coptis chinensis TaxID=261450 RepID=A0A835HWD0_9MAGN|nr:hypothetical protein IFM89_017587 [Coptis chinensis]